MRKKPADKGLLVVFEGIDGSGKSTQAAGLARRLKRLGYGVVSLREPSRGPWGRLIKRLARDPDSLTAGEELALFIRDRRDNVARNIMPALRRGRAVILDRYYYSTMAYQGARGISPERIRRLNERFAPRPDLVFILDIEPAAGLARISGRRTRDELFEQEHYLVRVARIFRGFRGRHIVHLDGGREKRELSREVAERTDRLLARKRVSFRRPR
jgi:dTMP kinase